MEHFKTNPKYDLHYFSRIFCKILEINPIVQKSRFQTLAFVKRDKRNHLTSFVSIKGSVNFSSFNVDNKHGIDVGPTTNPAAVTDTIPVKTGKKLYSIVATNAESLLDIHFQSIIRII